MAQAADAEQSIWTKGSARLREPSPPFLAGSQAEVRRGEVGAVAAVDVETLHRRIDHAVLRVQLAAVAFIEVVAAGDRKGQGSDARHGVCVADQRHVDFGEAGHDRAVDIVVPHDVGEAGARVGGAGRLQRDRLVAAIVDAKGGANFTAGDRHDRAVGLELQLTQPLAGLVLSRPE